jgi:hypothetical protein
MKALQMIGNLFEVGAFLERKESTIVHKSSDIRTRLLERLGKASDVKVKDDALTLLEEIKGGDGTANASPDTPTAGVVGHLDGAHTHDLTHTVPLTQSSIKSSGVPPTNSGDLILDFDKE